MTPRPATLSAALGLAVLLGLAGCGGTDDAPSSPSTSSPESSASSASGAAPTTSTSSASSATAASTEPQFVPVPAQDDGQPGLANATEFPVPAGATVDDSYGAPFNGSWQFAVSGVEPEELAAFYEQVLPPLGYTVSTDAAIVVGANEIEYAVGWSGPTYGTVDSSTGLVSVNDRPADGLTLNGAPVG